MKFAYLIEPPFNYLTSEGQICGHDVDLALHVFKALKMESVELIETEFADLLPGLANAQWSMTTGLFSTKERQNIALFSRPIWALPDGLLVQKGNPQSLNSYRSIAENSEAILAVIRDQHQHRTAIYLGIPEHRLSIFNTYQEAAKAVRESSADAYASVGRAHSGFINQNSDWEIELVDVPVTEKPPAFGSFAFALNDEMLRNEVDDVLQVFLGSDKHRSIASQYGFNDEEVRLVMEN